MLKGAHIKREHVSFDVLREKKENDLFSSDKYLFWL